MTERPLILISNDDGFQAKGIRCLVDMLRDIADIIVCAPDSARSGFSCAFSATTPLRLTLQKKSEGIEIWSCNGTPVDCVKMALANICQRMPQMVIGGINHGDNASVNTHYSGTMGVTLEGCLKFIPSVAYSLCDNHDDADFEPLRPYIRKFTEKVLNEGLPKGICLNVNVPPVENGPLRGIKVTKTDVGRWVHEFAEQTDPYGRTIYWTVGEYSAGDTDDHDTDTYWLGQGYATVVPCQVDQTAVQAIPLMDELSEFNHQE